MQATILSVAFLGAIAASAAPLSDNKLHFNDQCIAYVKAPATGYMVMSLVDCDAAAASEFTWDSAANKFETTVSGADFCIPEALTTCAAAPAPVPRPPTPPTCQRTRCPKGQIFDMGKCSCVPEVYEPEVPQCRKQCPEGTYLDPAQVCTCIPKVTPDVPQCKKTCEPGWILDPYQPCTCVPEIEY